MKALQQPPTATALGCRQPAAAAPHFGRARGGCRHNTRGAAAATTAQDGIRLGRRRLPRRSVPGRAGARQPAAPLSPSGAAPPSTPS